MTNSKRPTPSISAGNSTEFDLPKDFIFGVATAAYQIEGAAAIDGRTPSIWDTFSHVPGNVLNNDNGDIACDHYHRWKSDVDILQQLNVDAYRFSFSWSRLIPDAHKNVNPKGLAFYDRLIDTCLEKDIQLFATLYHWDLPQSLQDAGGWLNRDTAYRFADYAHIASTHFADRLASISTFNEPWCSAMKGHLYGDHAPGIKDLDSSIKVVHHQHLAHGLAIQAMRNNIASQKEVHLGIVLNLQSIYPGDDSDSSVRAAQRHQIFHNAIYLDPLFNAQYPDEFVDELGTMLPDNWQDDLNTINQPLDFWGLNYYTPARVIQSSDVNAPYPSSDEAPRHQSTPLTDIGWEIAASTFGDLLIDVYKNYDLPPCYITENGACINDQPVDGVVNDQRRTDYLDTHIASMTDALNQGVPIKGYFAWSLMDNFEWYEGYTMRFGLVHVNYETQERTIKDSGYWYSAIAQTQKDKRNA